MNTNAIDKIIGELARKDFEAVNLLINGRRKYKKHKPYALSHKTLNALEIKKQYINEQITEEEYKAYCLKYNVFGGILQ